MYITCCSLLNAYFLVGLPEFKNPARHPDFSVKVVLDRDSVEKISKCLLVFV